MLLAGLYGPNEGDIYFAGRRLEWPFRARALGIEKSTVRSHVSTILNKLDLDNRTQAALYAVELGLGRSGDKS